MTQGDIFLVTESKHWVSLGYSGIIRPSDFDEARAALTSAVLIDDHVDLSDRARISGLCEAAGVPLLILPESDLPYSEAGDQIKSPAVQFMRQYHKLAHTAQLAPENFDKIELQTLVDIITTTNSLLKPREVMDSVMMQINELIACEAWSVLIVDDADAGFLSFAAAKGPNKETLLAQRIPVGEGIAGWVAQKSKPLIVNNVAEDPRFFDQFDKETDFRTRSILCAPLISRGRTIGVIEMINRKNSQGFSEADLELVEVLVNPAAVAIENAFLFQRAEILTIQDDLTKLYNSRYLNKCLDFELQRARRLGQSLSVLFIDLDGFKAINDCYGHLQGSRSLIEIGEIIKLAARETDIVGRYGGDEFMLILPSTDTEGAFQVADRIRQHVACYRLHDMTMTASIGISAFPEHSQEKHGLIRMADKAMYWVKDHGKNGIAIADQVEAS